LEPVDECIFGLLQRTRPHEFHKAPQEGGAEVVAEEWQGAYVLIDPTHHDEGQRVAVENDVVGQPRALLKSLVSALNDRNEAPYQIEVEPLFDASRFWSFARRHDNVLKSVTFDFVVPNMWGTETDLEKDLKDTGKQTGAERVTVGITGEHGVMVDNQKVRDGVEYAEKGAGTVRARALDGQRFYSTARARITRIPAVKAGGAALVDYFSKLRKKILGREQDSPVDNPSGNGDGPSVD